jgi:hypothetical protein
MSSVEFIYLHRFVQDITEYFSNIKAMKNLVASTANIAAEAAKEAFYQPSEPTLRTKTTKGKSVSSSQ